MPVSADLGGIAAALVGAISLLLTELRARRADTPLTDNQIREALLRLEMGLREWHKRATETNHAASLLITRSNDREVRSMFMSRVSSNSAYGNGLLLWYLRDGDDPATGLGALVRVYAPDLCDLAERFSDRINAVEAVLAWAIHTAANEDELNHCERQEMFDQLERTRQALDDSADEVAAFIRESFPPRAP